MSEFVGSLLHRNKLWSVVVVITALILAILLGYYSSKTLVILLFAGAGVLLVLQRPAIGVLALVVTAVALKFNLGTGTEVNLNPVIILIPVVFAVWVLDMARKGKLELKLSRTYYPLFLLLVMGIASLLIGNATWDPFVPKPINFLYVQLAQLAIFFLSAAGYILTANLVHDEEWLKYLVWTFLAISGVLSIFFMIPQSRALVGSFATAAINRAPFWMLLTAVAGGQLFFNQSLKLWQKLYLLLILLSVGFYSFVIRREVVSVWIGAAAVVGMLFWMRFPRFRWVVMLGAFALLAAGVLFPAIYQFAGGDAEWSLSGITRIDLGRRVLEVTMRNPITGLGPASYRVYASVAPLVWRGGSAIWIGAVVSSHNNYIDIFSFFGLIGLGLFLWFMVELGLLANRMRSKFKSGFNNGYSSGMMAAWVGTMVIMAFADWFLPFVYNVGFTGFQASILVWLFFGGLVVLENLPEKREDP